jgi:multidrug resistance efflux pump
MPENTTETTKGRGRIPIPAAQRFRYFRYVVMPFVSFAVCVLLTAYLWQRESQLPQTVGEVEAVRIDIAAGADGTLSPLYRSHWTLFDRVEAGEVVARVDERPVQAQMKTLYAELTQLRKELIATEEQIALDQVDREHDQRRETFRLAWQIQRHRLDVLDRKALIETDRVELMRLEERVRFLERMRGDNVVSALELVEEQLRRDRVKQSVAENEKAKAEAEEQRRRAVERLQEYPDARQPQADKLLGPFEAAITVQEARMAELQVQIDGLQIRAPISGTIVAVFAWPGQNVLQGDPVLTLAAERGRYVVGYLRQAQRIRPAVGNPVDVRPRVPGARPVSAVVGRVGPQVELIPPHQRRDPRVLEWGLPVRITLPDGLAVRPGELVDIRFTRKPSKAG